MRVRARGSVVGTGYVRALAIGILLGLVGVAGACREDDALGRVRALQAQARWEDSVELLRALVDADPSDARLHLEYGKALLATGEATRAIWPLRRAAESETFGAEAGVLLSMALLATNNSEDAIDAASKVLERDTENPGALFARGRALLGAKREEEALDDIEAYVDRMPEEPQGRLVQIGLLVMLSRVDEAEAAIADAAPLFESLVDEQPEQTARFCMLEALFVWEKGDTSRGGKKIDACLDRFPTQVVAVQEATSHFDRVRDPRRATAVVRAALEREPRQPQFRLMLADRLRTQGDAKRAEEILREGTSVLEGPEPWLALHDHFVAVEDYAAARDAIEHALALQPDPPAALRIAHADDLILSGDLDAADQVAADIPPPGGNLMRGRILLARGRATEALRELEEGIRLWPDNPSARWLAGQAAEHASDFPRAISHYRESVRADAHRTPAAKALAEIYAAMGAGRDAVDFALRHFEANPTDPEAVVLVIEQARRFGVPSARQAGLAALAAMPGQADRLTAQQALERAASEGNDAAIAWLEADVSQHPLERIESLGVLTTLELESGRERTAERRLAGLLGTHPDAIELLLLIARAGEKTGVPRAQRREWLERARRSAPGDSRIRLALARLETEVDAGEGGAAAAPSGGDREASEESLEAVLAIDPRDVTAALALARRLAARDPLSDRALALARTAALLGAAVPAAETLGHLLVERGDFTTAVPVLERAVSSFAEAGTAQYWLGLAQAGLGQESAAREAFEASLDSRSLTAEQRTRAKVALEGRSPTTTASDGRAD